MFWIIFDGIVFVVASFFAIWSGIRIRRIKDSAVVMPPKLRSFHGITLFLALTKAVGILLHIVGATDLSDWWGITKGGWNIILFILNIIF